MPQNKEIIEKFYTSFQNKDSKTMLECYHEDIEFSDPVFQNLKGIQAKAMWMMLIEKSPELKILFSNIQSDGDFASADWEADYPFGKTKRQIHNKIHAEFQLKDGKIINHKDNFSLWKWAGMALGISGVLLGFTSKIQNKIRSEAMTGLTMYMKRKRLL
ncbi:MAG: nuclear transport factor 2 family protein [Leptospiraceae bacterium]|nr:nuclear transport factor 2 family protein [Leptospiraceae bacterium]MCK6381066.1 nuclear transport factor 2 family protein [Leptospiraceae bacterium]NUM43042.1 nuclear transport factor 2 family protein [Leptospiraceae bacterium]